MDDIKQAVLDALDEEGCEAEIDDDGDISFEADEEIFYVCFAEEEQDYFRVIWLSDSFEAGRRAELLDKINELTMSYRVVKVYLSDADDGTCFVTCAVETFAEAESFVQYLPDYIALLQEAAGEVEAF